MKYKFGPYTLSTDQLLLQNDGAPVALEPQVFALLRLLIENHDRAVTRDEIFEVIWQNRVVSDAALSSRIKVARAAVGDDGSRQDVIRTVHGHGFHFVADVIVEASTTTQQQEARPSLAILQTEFISASDTAAEFAKGFEAELVTALGRMRALHVARAPSGMEGRRYATELGVRYLLSTRMRFSGASFRLHASLIHAKHLNEVWSDQFEGEVDEPFLTTDRLTAALLGKLLPTILEVEIRRAVTEESATKGAYLDFLRALPLCWSLDDNDNARAVAFLESALREDAKFALAHGLLSWSHGQQLLFHWSADPGASLAAIQHHAELALAGSQNDTIVLTFVAHANNFAGAYDTALHHVNTALELNPNFAWAIGTLASTYLFLERVDDAIDASRRAIDLSPHDPIRFSYYLTLGAALYARGDYQEALPWLEQSVIENPKAMWGPRLIAACAAEIGDAMRTQDAVQLVHKHMPGATAEAIIALTPATDNVIRPALMRSLKMAGL